MAASHSRALAGLVAVLALCAAAAPASAAHISEVDAAVLNFALNLEYLEANFYSCVAYGYPIDASLWGAGGEAPDGCMKGWLSAKAYQIAQEIAEDEIAHVRLLRTVLGNASAPQPKIDIGAAFAAAANAAAGLALNSTVTLRPAFSPYPNDVFFYHGAFIFEDVGATAYAGAAALIENKAYLTAAAQILAVESYHAGAVRLLLAQLQDKLAPFRQPQKLKVRQVVQAISDLRDAVDGASDIDQGVVQQVKGQIVTNIVPADANGLIYTRNTDQVLRIVYLGGASKGGFFPNGLNGAIKAASGQ